MRLERTIDLTRLKPAQQLRRAIEHINRTGERRERLRQHAIHAILHRVKRHELLGHHGRGAVAHTCHKLERRQIHIAKGRKVALIAAGQRGRRQCVLGLGKRAQRHGTQLERRILEHQAQRTRTQAFGIARRHVAVEHARCIRRIALDGANVQALGD